MQFVDVDTVYHFAVRYEDVSYVYSGVENGKWLIVYVLRNGERVKLPCSDEQMAQDLSKGFYNFQGHVALMHRMCQIAATAAFCFY